MTTTPHDRYEDKRLVRVGLLVGMLAGSAVPLYFFLIAETIPLAWDFRAYRFAASLVQHGNEFIGVTPPVGAGEFVYPPITVFAFYPFAALPWSVAYLIQVAVSGCTAVCCGLLVVHHLQEQNVSLTGYDRKLIVGFCALSTYPLVVYGQGQVDFLVVLALIATYVLYQHDRPVLSGVALGVASIFKLFPLFIGLWYLRHRAWRAIVGLGGTCATAFAASVGVFGIDLHRQYLQFLLAERSRVDQFETGMSADFSGLTLSRPLSGLFPQLDPALYTPIAAALLLPVVALLYTRLRSETDRLIAYLATLIAMLLVSPATNVHHVIYLYFPLVPLLYCTDDRQITRLFTVGLVILSLPFQPGHIAQTFALLGFPAEVVAAVVAIVRPVLTIASVPLFGLVIILAGCVAYKYRTLRERPSVEPPVASD